MRGKLLGLVLTSGLVLPLGAPGVARPVADDLAGGIRQVEEGDLEAAVATLDGVVKELRGQVGRERDLSLAHLYLSMAHLGLSEWERAKAEMREAWRNDKDLRLDPRKFPPHVIRLYEETRAEVKRAEASPAPTPKPATPSPTPEPASGASPAAPGGSRGSKAPLVILGVAGAGAAVAGIAAAGGGPSPSPVTTVASAPVGEITFVGSVPPPGSTVSLRDRRTIAMTFNVVYSEGVTNAWLDAITKASNGQYRCNFGQARFSLPAGQMQTITVNVDASFWGERCTPLPTQSVAVLAQLTDGTGTIAGRAALQREFSVSYVFVP